MAPTHTTSFNLKETDMYLLIGKALKSAFGLHQSALFFEVPVGESRGDILYVQTPAPYETGLAAGLHLFEVKMRWDNGRKRMTKQLSDYMEAVDYVWVVGVNTVLEPGHENVGVLVFSTNGCAIDVVKGALHNRGRIDLAKRQNLLADVADGLKRKYRMVTEMAWVNPVGENRILVQKKL